MGYLAESVVKNVCLVLGSGPCGEMLVRCTFVIVWSVSKTSFDVLAETFFRSYSQGLQALIHQISINSPFFSIIFSILHRRVPILLNHGVSFWVILYFASIIKNTEKSAYLEALHSPSQEL